MKQFTHEINTLIEQYNLSGPQDEEMNNFIREKQQQIQNADPGERAKIMQNLEQMVANLKGNDAAREVKGIIKDYRDRAGLFTSGNE